jgi:hypothetical protein
MVQDRIADEHQLKSRIAAEFLQCTVLCLSEYLSHAFRDGGKVRIYVGYEKLMV